VYSEEMPYSSPRHTGTAKNNTASVKQMKEVIAK
jgi:hypothetical protein